MKTISQPRTRPLTAADAARAGAVIVTAFNKVFRDHGFPPPFPSLESGQQLAASYAAYELTRGVVCEDESGRILGVAFVHPRGATAGIGPVAVEPAFQARQVGRQLMEGLFAAAPGVVSFRLTQDAFNNVSFALYHRLGFVVRDVMLSLERAATGPLASDLAGIRPLEAADIPRAVALDKELTGIERPGDFAYLLGAGGGFLLERGGELRGFLLRRLFGRHMMLGPAAATDEDALHTLIAAALAASPGASVGMRFLASQPALLNRLFADGFRIGHLGNYMVRGAWSPPAGLQIPAAYPEAL